MSYIIIEGLRKIEIVAGEERLCHYFKEMGVKECLVARRNLAQLEDANQDDIRAQNYLEIYRGRCEKVEGYETPDGRDLMEALPDEWKQKIPGNHICMAVDELLSGNDLKKKS